MCDDSLFNNIGQSVPIAQHEYCGPTDYLGLRNGQACEKWIREYYQKYNGRFLLDNLHGEGVYVLREGRKKRIVYNGKFYSNLLEGYAEVIYANGSFEGLFKKHAKFGPGVRTWVDGTQDVGLWNESDLMRLSSVVQRDWIPSLARSTAAKTKLLKYKNLVPISNTTYDIAKEILMELDANEEVLAQSDKLYNMCIRDPGSMFFNKTLYDDAFFSSKDCFIEVAMTTEEEEEENQCESDEQELASLDDSTCCGCGTPEDLLLIEINDGLRNVCSDLAEVETRIANLEEQMLNASKPITVNHSDDTIHSDILFQSQSEEFEETVHSKTLDEIRNELHEAKVLQNVLSGIRKHLKARLHNEKNNKPTTNTPLTKPVFVTDLLPWNNEKLSEDILKHCFLHKNSEGTININISDILAGNRKSFGPPGIYEKDCTSFLEHCSEGRRCQIVNLLQKCSINPDITDANGNSGITFAAARDKISAIKVLINYGAKVDILNDEGLTPLTMCLLRYIAVQNGVTDWENAFVPQAALATEDDYGSNVWLPPDLSSSSTSLNKDQSDAIKPTTLLEIDTKSFFESKLLKQNLTGENVFSKLQSFVSLNEKIKFATCASECLNFQLPYAKAGDNPQNYVLNTDCVVVKENLQLNQMAKRVKLNPREKENAKIVSQKEQTHCSQKGSRSYRNATKGRA